MRAAYSGAARRPAGAAAGERWQRAADSPA